MRCRFLRRASQPKIQSGEQNWAKTNACLSNSFNDTYISEIPGWLNGAVEPDPEPVPGKTLERVYADVKAKAPNARIVDRGRGTHRGRRIERLRRARGVRAH